MKVAFESRGLNESVMKKPGESLGKGNSQCKGPEAESSLTRSGPRGRGRGWSKASEWETSKR